MDAIKERSELVKVKSELLEKLRIISAVRRKTMGDLIEEYAGEKIDAEHAAVIREQHGATKKRKRRNAGDFDLGGES